MNPTLKIAAVALAALAIGCNTDTHKVGINDQFRPDSEARSVDNIFAQQKAIAAREDGQLYAAHFKDGELNSLGYAKLDAMLTPNEMGLLNVYLNVPKDSLYGPRESAVVAYLANKGYASNAYNITAGYNPNNGTPAAQGLRGLSKQQAAAAEGEGDAPAAAVGAK
jgi:hypothetical protein